MRLIIINAFLAHRTMLSRTKCPCQVVRCVDQGDVREGLWEVADEAFGLQVVLLRQEAKIGSQREQALEQRSRILVAALQNVIVGQPEAAGEKDSLLAAKAVSGGRLRRDTVSVPLSGSSAGWVQSVPLPDLTQGGL